MYTDIVNCLSNKLSSHVFKLRLKNKINVKNCKKCEKSLCKSGRFCVSVYSQTLIKHEFLFNFLHELLMI